MKDLFTSYSFNPPLPKKKNTKQKRKTKSKPDKAPSPSTSSSARFDKFLNHEDEPSNSSILAKAAFASSSESRNESMIRDPNDETTADQYQSATNYEEEEEEDELNEEEEEDLQNTIVETDLNLNHFIECLDIFGGAPALKGPGPESKNSSKEASDDAITEEFRKRAREKRERDGLESPEKRSGPGNKSKDEKDRTALRMSWEGHGHPFVLL